MNQYKSLTLILLMMAFNVSAESFVYITDQVEIPIRSEMAFGNNIIRTLPSGTELSILSTEDGWAQIKFDDTIGWIGASYLSIDPPAREQLKKLQRTYNANKLLISKLQSEKEVIENQYLLVKKENESLVVQSSKSQA